MRLLILEEPMAALSESDSQALLDLLLELRAQGVTTIIISQKLNKVRRIADRVTMLRDGATIPTLDARGAAITEDRKTDGIIDDLSIREGIILGLQTRRDWARRIPRADSVRIAEDYIKCLEIRVSGREKRMGDLSGATSKRRCWRAGWR